MQNQTNAPLPSFWEDSGSDRKGLAAWLLSTDHKRIGLMYLYMVIGMFIIGVCLGLAIRLELLPPAKPSWRHRPTTQCSHCTVSS